MEPLKENWFTYFPENYRWSAGLLIALGTAPWGSSDIGEIDRIGKRLKNRVGDDEAWFDEWIHVAEDLEKKPREAQSKGLTVQPAACFSRLHVLPNGGAFSPTEGCPGA